LEFEDVMRRFEQGMEWLARLYVNTMNCIHWSHDKYCYERVQMALHDTHVRRLIAFGVSGLSVIADSLSAIAFAKVTPIHDSRGIITDFHIEGDFPKYGNDDNRVDNIAKTVVEMFSRKLRQHQTYRDSISTLSVLTITSNIQYGKMTGSTPDGRKQGEPFAPGANPMHGREVSGAIASLNSVSKLPYNVCLDGISNTFTIVPATLGKDAENRKDVLLHLLDGYFKHGGFHINVNCLTPELLQDAIDHPESYPNLTVRISGYAVRFNSLTQEQKREFIERTFFNAL
jgi:formate C-acetyltransferase